MELLLVFNISSASEISEKGWTSTVDRKVVWNYQLIAKGFISCYSKRKLSKFVFKHAVEKDINIQMREDFIYIEWLVTKHVFVVFGGCGTWKQFLRSLKVICIKGSGTKSFTHCTKLPVTKLNWKTHFESCL